MKTKISKRAAQLLEMTTPDQTCLRALLVFAAQNPGFEWCNYATSDWKASRRAYLGDSRPVAKQLRTIRSLGWRFPSLDNATMKKASGQTYSGRLQFKEDDRGVSVDYCTGQYWPTEYRQASLAVIKEAIRIASNS